MSAPLYKVPPDGGYGWVVTFAYALNNVVILPLISSFGLVFQEAFDETGLTPTQGTLVITLNHSIGMLLSFFGGPLLRRFGYRKVAVVGAILISAGLLLTSFASSFWIFILSYSILNSMGVASVMAAFTLAINSFFKDKRSRAIGVGMSVTGLGAIYMPLLMSTLIYAYGWRYAVLILSAICLHSLLAACLLRPAKWYLKEPPIPEEIVPLNKETDVELVNGTNGLHASDIKENGFALKSLSMRSLNSNASMQSRNAASHPDVRPKQSETPLAEARYKWWESQEVNLGSSINIFHEIENKRLKEIESLRSEETEKKSYFQNFIDFFDLTLLKDPIFVSILIGLSVAACVETNFSLLLPIILRDMLKFETSEIAQIMSIIGFSDTLFRLLAPFIGEWCKKSPRVMYMVSLLLVIFIRTIMLFVQSYLAMVFVALAMGFTKGIRTVYMNLVIPCYVPLERLPFASGIQMFFNGIMIATIGSLLGRIRESSGAYVIPIIVLNIVTFFTIIIWSGEFLYLRTKNKQKSEGEIDA